MRFVFSRMVSAEVLTAPPPRKFHDVIGVEREEFLKRCCGTATEIFGKRAAGVGRAAISTDERYVPVKHVVEILSKDAGECPAS